MQDQKEFKPPLVTQLLNMHTLSLSRETRKRISAEAISAFEENREPDLYLLPHFLKADFMRRFECDRIAYVNKNKGLFDPGRNKNWLTGWNELPNTYKVRPLPKTKKI